MALQTQLIIDPNRKSPKARDQAASMSIMASSVSAEDYKDGNAAGSG